MANDPTNPTKPSGQVAQVANDPAQGDTAVASTDSDSGMMTRQTRTRAPEVDAYIGTKIAERYKVTRKLGEGGMGTVYLAEHVMIEKQVAIKILSEDFARKDDLVQRFMQEARAASKIGHENIIDITDFGETPSGSVFFVMEFLDGHDLAYHIREGGPMPVERIHRIMNQLCRALGAAHGKGIIHRDLKPENIYLIEREGRPDFVKVLDFGIAKISGFDDSGSRLTRTGMIFGTPEYMSPEQARGDRPDHRVDIYAAGCILYEMLTGDVPFHAETFMGVLTKHMFEAPEPPSRRAPNANVPADLEAVVMRALAKDRDQRFQSMKEMALALEEGLGGDVMAAWGEEASRANISLPGGRDNSGALKLSTQAVAPLPMEPDAPPRSKAGFIAAGALGLALLGGGGWYVLKQPSTVTPSTNVTNPVPTPTPDTPKEPDKPKAVVEPTTPVEPPVAKQVHILVRSKPVDAEIMNGNEMLGKTSMSVTLPLGQEPVTLTLKKRGFRDYDLKFVPSQDRGFQIDLVKEKGAASSKPVVTKTTATKTDPKQADPKPAQQDTKPAGKLRDLKDPFAN